ncbi:outer membrane protein transport protein [Parasalinivibrio latis]|uniref:outer membrane protein transport protein n=1 Tax=Parasalinivibrio latis TaxID=2952610 RepID=UPI0030DE53D4
MKKLSATVLPAFMLAALSPDLYAAGFQVSEHSASGLGRAFSGEGAIADNASVLARNPAAMTRFDTPSLSVSGTLIDPAIEVTFDSFSKGPQTAKDIAPVAYIPSAYFITPVNQKISAGVALFSNYGVSTDYPDAFAPGSAAGNTSLTSVNINPNIAYDLNNKLSIGLGIDLVYATAELGRHYGSLSPAMPSAKTINMEGTTFAWGWNAGLLFQPNETSRLGLTYRSQVDLDFNGDFTDYTGTITGSANKGKALKSDLTVVLPAIAEFSAYHEINKKWAFHYSLQWTEWSHFKELKATNPACQSGSLHGVCFLKKEDYKNSVRYAVGTTYKLSKAWTLRAGYAVDEQAGKPTLSIPDTDRKWLTSGITYQSQYAWSIDAGFAYVFGATAHFQEEGDTFTSGGDAMLSSVQFNYAF